MWIDVNEFLSLSSDTDMIQKAIDTARETGEAVVIPKYNKRTGESIWNIDKAIVLYDETTVILQNAHLRLADYSICNMFTNSNARKDIALEEEGKQRNITIRGIGSALLDGGNHNGLYEVNGIARSISKYPDKEISLNCLMYFQNVENLVVENLKIKNQRYWGICMYTTSYSRISNITYESDSNVPNQDGIDIMKGSHDIIVENIRGCVGDNIVALLATEDEIYSKVVKNERDGDIRNITIRNIMVYGVGGCALIRLLNHDGYRIYNVRIDNVIEVSPWSENDAPVAQNPDLIIVSDEDGNIVHERHLVPGEEGYRCEAAILIGESYWYNKSKAQHGDTFGISVSNVMTHARCGLFLNNTLLDSSFDNIRMFGNGFAAVYFGEGEMENLRFTNISYDKTAKPLKEDEHIFIEWNNTKSDGFSCVQANGTKFTEVCFDNMRVGAGMESVFGGHGEGCIKAERIICKDNIPLATISGVEVKA